MPYRGARSLSLPVLVATPCPKNWDVVVGGECATCGNEVARDAGALIESCGGDIGALRVRADGQVMRGDCAHGRRARRARALGWVASVISIAAFAAVAAYLAIAPGPARPREIPVQLHPLDQHGRGNELRDVEVPRRPMAPPWIDQERLRLDVPIS